MSKTETKARTGEDVSPVQEVKQAVSGFMSEFNGFQAEIQIKLQQTEERLNMLDRKTQIAARPHLAGAVDMGAPHQKAFNAYLRSGDDDGLRGLELEGKALSTAVNSDGGYLVDPQTSETVQSVLKSTASIRAIANVVNVEATSYDVLVDHTDVGAGWATEAAATAETGTPQIDRITIPLHELSALPKASQRLLDDSAFDIEGWLAGRIADKFARAEAAAFVSGDGVNKPTGFLSGTLVDEGIWSWGNIGYVPTGLAGAFPLGDESDVLVDLVYALKSGYRQNASWVMNRRTQANIRKLKDADGNYIWQPSAMPGSRATLMGFDLVEAEDMPDIAADSTSIAFGDFRRGYLIVDRQGVNVLRDPFSSKPYVLFYTTKRVGGGVSDFDAIKLLKFAAS